ncbi:hypothetical protein M5C72_07180 [Companilactobacillus allii]|uniref:Uncharacterized protein n=1 Tax=Companilactobacillus allii TaxID=1847728 RepID=A0A1P8Q4V0_9LACO|nr:hypothetical protein [Companilactobacillus allii]APX72880.1 hypothetical protein BTM29_10095 [Companilactobacillus allii]USQ67668.1 hypothetical protein M5C72_07180 [Companilactobacillus allii]
MNKYKILMSNNDGDFYKLINNLNIVEMYRLVEKGKMIFGEISNGHKVYINSSNIELLEEIKDGGENESN